jgi:hypothetical protein
MVLIAPTGRHVPSIDNGTFRELILFTCAVNCALLRHHAQNCLGCSPMNKNETSPSLHSAPTSALTRLEVNMGVAESDSKYVSATSLYVPVLNDHSAVDGFRFLDLPVNCATPSTNYWLSSMTSKSMSSRNSRQSPRSAGNSAMRA